MRIWILGVSLALAAPGMGQWLVPPTENQALFNGPPSQFYMHVERNFEGQLTKPWEGGQYGYVRGPHRVGSCVLYGHLHEGIDIAPLHRDAAGEPLDPVAAAAAGRVAYVSDQPGASNYGRYVVLEHRLDGGVYYTLYAHLKRVRVQPGEPVAQCQPIGDMGYTGDGITRERSHLHFEVCLLASGKFQEWYDLYQKSSPNKHGLINGMNLIGMDPAALLRGVRANPRLTIPDFVRSLKPLFQITINDSPNFELIRRYPWLVGNGEIANPPAWTITFSETGVPMRVRAYSRPIGEPLVEWLDPAIPPTLQSRGWIGGTASAPRLTDSGGRFLHLLAFD
ncbi:MAG TPA: M23 family metallopeptidase [Chthoniobacterales bacterium]